ncbi:hypothetical protein V9T40_011756 [Parthenolecanium corni]|uniref:Uncharacterized protein n=1 Tax=Parthenolecanium corni TaxID=536013 RepID=A0AAN9T8D5_9HEMI
MRCEYPVPISLLSLVGLKETDGGGGREGKLGQREGRRREKNETIEQTEYTYLSHLAELRVSNYSYNLNSPTKGQSESETEIRKPSVRSYDMVVVRTANRSAAGIVIGNYIVRPSSRRKGKWPTENTSMNRGSCYGHYRNSFDRRNCVWYKLQSGKVAKWQSGKVAKWVAWYARTPLSALRAVEAKRRRGEEGWRPVVARDVPSSSRPHFARLVLCSPIVIYPRWIAFGTLPSPSPPPPVDSH